MSEPVFIAVRAIMGDRPSAKVNIGIYIAAYPEHGEAIFQMRMSQQTATVSLTPAKIDETIRALAAARVVISTESPK